MQSVIQNKYFNYIRKYLFCILDICSDNANTILIKLCYTIDYSLFKYNGKPNIMYNRIYATIILFLNLNIIVVNVDWIRQIWENIWKFNSHWIHFIMKWKISYSIEIKEFKSFQDLLLINIMLSNYCYSTHYKNR